jgi:hypothetical protein
VPAHCELPSRRYKNFLGLTNDKDFMVAAAEMKRKGDFTSLGSDAAAISAIKSQGMAADQVLGLNGAADADATARWVGFVACGTHAFLARTLRCFLKPPACGVRIRHASADDVSCWCGIPCPALPVLGSMPSLTVTLPGIPCLATSSTPARTDTLLFAPGIVPPTARR